MRCVEEYHKLIRFQVLTLPCSRTPPYGKPPYINSKSFAPQNVVAGLTRFHAYSVGPHPPQTRSNFPAKLPWLLSPASVPTVLFQVGGTSIRVCEGGFDHRGMFVGGEPALLSPKGEKHVCRGILWFCGAQRLALSLSMLSMQNIPALITSDLSQKTWVRFSSKM